LLVRHLIFFNSTEQDPQSLPTHVKPNQANGKNVFCGVAKASRFLSRPRCMIAFYVCLNFLCLLCQCEAINKATINFHTHSCATSHATGTGVVKRKGDRIVIVYFNIILLHTQMRTKLAFAHPAHPHSLKHH